MEKSVDKGGMWISMSGYCYIWCVLHENCANGFAWMWRCPSRNSWGFKEPDYFRGLLIEEAGLIRFLLSSRPTESISRTCRDFSGRWKMPEASHCPLSYSSWSRWRGVYWMPLIFEHFFPGLHCAFKQRVYIASFKNSSGNPYLITHIFLHFFSW